ncbi:MAG: SIS domain-containing protein [Chitinophagaceae bacterium]|nr:SIS domain-containing protein [Chitinophagaceae bacterium]
MAIQYYLGIRRKELATLGALDTAAEIEGQPALWKAVYDLVQSSAGSLNNFLDPVLALPHLRIILAGAGSSAFIGEAAQGIIQSATKRITQAIATTDLVTHPSLYFLRDIPTLLISFARSGNSPESAETIRLADVHCDSVWHLIITCNGNGELARSFTGKNLYTFLLPDNANDKGLAMTGSFTGMLLAVTLISRLKSIKQSSDDLDELIDWAEDILENYIPLLRDLCNTVYERVIFLGSGPLLGIARECHLKLQELTDGKVICKHDSFLGFRHGPRAVTNNETLVVYLFSADEKAYQYEKDLAISVSSTTPQVHVVAVGQNGKRLNNVKLEIDASPGGGLGFIGYVMIAQLMGFFQSMRLGLQPDHPSVNGNIHRVVQGVTIYH